MNVYKDFAIVHNMQLDPRDVKLFVDWLKCCEKNSAAYLIGEAMQAAMDNYISGVILDNIEAIEDKSEICPQDLNCEKCLQSYLNRDSVRPLNLKRRENK